MQISVTRGAQKTREIPPEATAIRVRVLGTSIVQVIPFPPGTSSVTVVLNGVPLGNQTILIEALQGDEVIATSEISVNVTAGDTTSAAVADLTPVNPVNPVVPPTLRFSGQPPAQVVSGFTSTSVQVQAVNAQGQPDPTFTTPITLSITPATASLSAETLTVTPVNGVASFTDVSIIGTAGTYRLIATAGQANATSNSFTVVVGHLAFSDTLNPSQTVGRAITTQGGSAKFTVTVLDDNNQPLTQASGSATLTLQTASPAQIGPVGGPPVPVVFAPLVDGVATFSNLAVSAVASNCRLRVAAGPTSVTSSLFDVGPQTAAGAIYVGGPNALVRYDLGSGTTIQQTLGYTPLCMNAMTVVTGLNGATTNFLFVGGSDSVLHAVNPDTLAELFTAATLSGIPAVMRNDGRWIYVSVPLSDAANVYDTAILGPSVVAHAPVVAFNHPHGIAVDPRPQPDFWLIMGASQFFTFQLDQFGSGAFSRLTAHIDNHTLPTAGFIDCTTAGTDVIGLQTAGNATPQPDGTTSTLSAFVIAETLPLASFGGTIRGAVQPVLNDVCFITTGNTTARALMADQGGSSMGVDLVTVHRAGFSPPTIDSVTPCSDNVGVPTTSRPTTINLVYTGTPASRVPAMGVVAISNEGQLVLMDLTSSDPTPPSYSVLSFPTISGTTAVTVFQQGFSQSR